MGGLAEGRQGGTSRVVCLSLRIQRIARNVLLGELDDLTAPSEDCLLVDLPHGFVLPLRLGQALDPQGSQPQLFHLLPTQCQAQPLEKAIERRRRAGQPVGVEQERPARMGEHEPARDPEGSNR